MATKEKSKTDRPHIIIIWGDDIGQTNVSAYSDGLMGYQTPNIDRVANEGMRFTDAYAEQSCTAGRSSFITGQCGFRTGNTKVGMPGAAQGLQHRDVTIAQLLKAQGYATAQFGKNHLGDRNEHLPTVHGFDEFYGALYHLNASEEPELPDYPNPKDFPNFFANYGPRGVLDCKATEKDDTTVDPRFGKVGKQTIKDTGPLTKKRMETCDDDFADRAVDFLKRQNAAGKPVFLWVNFTHMHLRTHTKPESLGQAGRWQSPYHDTMIDHDKNVGTVLKALDDLGMADNTIVMYSTDKGPHMNTWPDGAMTPFRNEKNSNWEGAYRVPCMVRWPGHIKPGTICNEVIAHLDWAPTLLAAAGVPDVKEQLLALGEALRRTDRPYGENPVDPTPSHGNSTWSRREARPVGFHSVRTWRRPASSSTNTRAQWPWRSFQDRRMGASAGRGRRSAGQFQNRMRLSPLQLDPSRPPALTNEFASRFAGFFHSECRMHRFEAPRARPEASNSEGNDSGPATRRATGLDSNRHLRNPERRITNAIG